MTKKIKVFIDGREGTTGLRIEERLAARDDAELIAIDPALRKDAAARAACLNACDVAFLCLPDAAAVEAIGLIQNPDVRVVDASTAHRTDPDWTYGLAELRGARARIAASKRVAVPGCHAGGFVALVAPLVREGVLGTDARLSCFSLTGYSGGGKKMIADYAAHPDELRSPRIYGLNQNHKHLKEMRAVSGLDAAPVFSPIVSSYYSGMAVTVPLFAESLGGLGKAGLIEFYRAYYADAPLVRVCDETAAEDGFLSGGFLAGRDDLQIVVAGGEERLCVTARFDNLGKGASGAAVQCFNLLTGRPETTGLVTE